MDLQLAGQTALVTGAASGIGRAAARALAAEGARVVMADIDKAGLEEAVGAVPRAPGGRPVTVAADLATEEGADETAAAALAACGDIDILVSNAGRCQFLELAELADRDWDAALQLNLMASVRLVRHLLPGMQDRRRGAIVFTGSDLARQPLRVSGEYAASKAALASYAKTLALAAAPWVRVNVVAPGPVQTGLWTRPGGLADDISARRGLPPREAVAREIQERGLPLGRIGQPEEAAAVICFLASPRASYVTGATWNVDGGSTGSLF